MRLLVSKYDGACAKCGTDLPKGAQIAYERITGVFCPGCFPTEPEAIREYRTARAEAKAERREEWAAARDRRANAAQRTSDVLMGRDRSPDGRADWALVTQPGHIPQRAQANRAQERAWREATKAGEHRAKAEALRSGVRVKGDAERRREERREAVRELVKARIGTMVQCHPYGLVKLLRVNRLSATVETPRGFRDRVCLTWVDIATKAEQGAQP